ncbi:PspC domain-containing protein [Streptomyces sp. NPDC048717]|uniref:PspC domain-containing protein n=1 Tax=Streptomyces sp. NPDC048717 TaxID=3154928 RepID=UPI00342451EC
MTSSMPSHHEAPPPAEAPPAPPLRRSRGQKVVAGVCGGLGRHYGLDPVIFRIALGVLAVTGGVGLIFYGFAWLLIPLAGEEENEGRRLLTGRVSGSSLAAVLLALVGCGIFLTTLNSGGLLGFSLILSLAVSGAAVWSQRRTAVAATADEGGRIDPAAALAVAEAPPETKAPPVIDFAMSWWRDPIVKDGSTGKVAVGYLWGPPEAADQADGTSGTGRESTRPGWYWTPVPHAPGRPAAPSRPVVEDSGTSIGGLVFVLALIAGGLGMGLTWHTHPLGTSLQIGLVAALAVIGAGLVLSSFLGRTGFGTLCLLVLTTGLLAAASALPKEISTVWEHGTWRPTAVTAVQPRYKLDTGVGRLDLSQLAIPAKTTVVTRARVGAGKLEVIVPQNATVRLRAHVGLGDLALPPLHTEATAVPSAPVTPPAQQPGQVAPPVRPPTPPASSPDDIDIAPDLDATRTLPPPPGVTPGGTLDLTLEVGLGQVEVTRAAS